MVTVTTYDLNSCLAFHWCHWVLMSSTAMISLLCGLIASLILVFSRFFWLWIVTRLLVRDALDLMFIGVKCLQLHVFKRYLRRGECLNSCGCSFFRSRSAAFPCSWLQYGCHCVRCGCGSICWLHLYLNSRSWLCSNFEVDGNQQQPVPRELRILDGYHQLISGRNLLYFVTKSVGNSIATQRNVDNSANSPAFKGKT